jgi:hypothetical protein
MKTQRVIHWLEAEYLVSILFLMFPATLKNSIPPDYIWDRMSRYELN